MDRHHGPVVKIAGICGRTEQAVHEASLARDLGYDVGLLSLAALGTESIDALIDHARAVADVIPLMGFYLQPAVGGGVLPFGFWRRFVEIENVAAIKIAPFNRYQTLDVVRAVAEAGRADEITLYTGNDDNIVADLLTTYRFTDAGPSASLRVVGGLLGHWAVWTKEAACLLRKIHAVCASPERPSSGRHDGAQVEPDIADSPDGLLTLGVQITDANAALFDAANGFAGCVPGIHEILRRQGLLAGRWCLDPAEDLSPGQMDEIDRVYAAYPHLEDDAFVAEHRDEWLR